jgi:hypothetical protein
VKRPPIADLRFANWAVPAAAAASIAAAATVGETVTVSPGRALIAVYAVAVAAAIAYTGLLALAVLFTATLPWLTIAASHLSAVDRDVRRGRHALARASSPLPLSATHALVHRSFSGSASCVSHSLDQLLRSTRRVRGKRMTAHRRDNREDPEHHRQHDEREH